mgnify:CR=1 FL=1
MKKRIEAQLLAGFLFCQAIKNIWAIDKAEEERKLFCGVVPSHKRK